MIGIVGVSGFLGRALSIRLDAAGRRTRLISRSFDRQLLAELEIAEHVHLDLGECDDFTPYLEGVRQVVFLANTMVPSTPVASFPEELSASISWQCDFLRSCGEVGVENVVFISSGGTVYGSAGGSMIDEMTRLTPISAYGVAKATVEMYLSLLNREFGIDVRILRVANAYGPGQPVRSQQGVVASLIHCAKTGEAFHVYGDGGIVRDFIHVSDVTEAIRFALMSPNDGFHIYNVGSGRGHSINEVIEIVKRATGSDFPVEYEQSRKVDVPVNVLDCTKIKNETGWRPKLNLEDGVFDTWRNLSGENEFPDLRA